jgi:hypothetical protein
MSFSLAVWQGSRPRDDADALAQFQRLYAAYAQGVDQGEPTPAIRTFVEALTAKYPDGLPDDRVDEGVWSDEPLAGNAIGTFFYFGIVGSRVDEVVPFVARVAKEHGLVCFDPQEARVLRT